MTITRQDIKILKSDNVSDFEDGGGRVTNLEVRDGESNDLFTDIPDTSRAYGDVDLVKVYPAVTTLDDEPLLGGVFSLGRLPEDESVNITLFTTKDWFDRRSGAINTLENYLAPAPLIEGQLLEKQLKGQKAVQIIMEEDGNAPAIGKSLYLVQNEDEVNEFSQFVMVAAISSQIRTFRIDKASVRKKVVTLELTTKLDYTFTGVSIVEYEAGLRSIANIRETRVADTTNYYTTKPLVSEVGIGDTVVKVPDIFTQLVPSAQKELGLSGVNPAGNSTTLLPTGNVVTFTIPNYTPSVESGYFIGNAVTPSSVSIETGTGVIIDKGGQLELAGVSVGSIRYTTGELRWLGSYNPSASDYIVSFKPAAAASVTSESRTLRVTEGNRGFTYPWTLFPAPSPTTLQVSYVALGDVYILRDNGAGELLGSDASFGTGTVNYETGDVLLSLGAEPDVDSYILYNWATDKGVSDVSKGAPSRLGVQITLPPVVSPTDRIDPQTIVVTWSHNGAKEAKIESFNRVLTGDATGIFDPETRIVVVEPNVLPPANTSFTVAYKLASNTIVDLTGSNALTVQQTPVLSAGGDYLRQDMLQVSHTLNLSGQAFYKGSLRVKTPVFAVAPPTLAGYRNYEDDLWQRRVFTVIDLPREAEEIGDLYYQEYPTTKIGTIDYTTGAIVFDIAGVTQIYQYANYFYPNYTVSSGGGGTSYTSYGTSWYYTSYSRLIQNYDDSSLGEGFVYKGYGKKVGLTISYETSTRAQTPKTKTVIADSLQLILSGDTGSNLIADSLNIDSFMGTLIARGTELLRLEDAQLVGRLVYGEVNIFGKSIKMTTWEEGAENKFVVKSAAVRATNTPVLSVSFRTPVTPIKPDSVQVMAVVTETGEQLNLTFDPQGRINTDKAQGAINYQTGLITVDFVQKINLTNSRKENRVTGSSTQRNSKGETDYGYNTDIIYWGTQHAGELYNGRATVVEGANIYGFNPLFVAADTIRYNGVGYSYLPLDKDILGVDTVKLPPSGRVPAYRKGDLILVKAEKQIPVPDLTELVAIPMGKTRLSLIELVDSLGVKVAYSAYDVDLDAGTMTLKSQFPASSYAAPFFANYHYQDMAVAGEVLITGEIKLTKQLTHVFEPADTLVASALLMGTMQSRVFNVFTQDVWENKFLDYREGDDSIFKFDTAVAPIEVTNDSCIQEEWALVLTTSTSFDFIGRNVGKIASGSTLEDFSPLNPVTGRPLLTMRKEGFSTGGSAGNVLRLNTNASNYPVWIVRTVLQSNATSLDHHFSLEFKGNKDRVL